MTDADGYFSPRDHPQEMVPDPSLPPQKVLEEEEAIALAAAAAAAAAAAGSSEEGEGRRRVMMGADEYLEGGGAGGNGGGGIGGVEGDGEGEGAPPRYTFAPDDQEGMVVDGFRGGIGMGGLGMGGIGMGGIGMGSMSGLGMGMGMGQVPIGMPMGMHQMQVPLPQVPPEQVPLMAQPPQPPPPPPPPQHIQNLPLMQPLQVPMSMSDRPDEGIPNSPASSAPDTGRCPCGENHEDEEQGLQCELSRSRRRVRGRRGHWRDRRHGKHRARHGCSPCVRAAVWAVCFFALSYLLWKAYHRFLRIPPRDKPWWDHNVSFPTDPHVIYFRS